LSQDASNGEIDTLYGLPGFGEVLRELQGSENRYNATLTILEPGDRKEEGEALVAMLFEFTREYKMQIGNVIPEKSYRFAFVPSLNPRQQELLPHLLGSLVDMGWFAKDGEALRLTEVGFGELYRNA
jgi:hypothetical protein